MMMMMMMIMMMMVMIVVVVVVVMMMMIMMMMIMMMMMMMVVVKCIRSDQSVQKTEVLRGSTRVYVNISMHVYGGTILSHFYV